MNLYPFKFRPILKSAIWGGEKITSFKDLDSDKKMVGESWELSGVNGSESVVANGEEAGLTITELLQKYGANLIGKANYDRFGDEFPLLIKFIDAKDDLSIQVHPDDELALERHNSKGKTEMWYVVDADKGAKLRSGFSRQVSAEEYVESVEKDCVTDILKEYDVNSGDLFFLPAGRIHSIGAGCFIAEIQQTSNITYRIYDFNRTDSEGNPRELHTEQAKNAIDYTVLNDYRKYYDQNAANCRVEMVKCPYFDTSIYNLTEPFECNLRSIDSFVIFICVEGEAIVDCDGYNLTIKQGETILVPATANMIRFKPNDKCRLLSTFID